MVAFLRIRGEIHLEYDRFALQGCDERFRMVDHAGNFRKELRLRPPGRCPRRERSGQNDPLSCSSSHLVFGGRGQQGGVPRHGQPGLRSGPANELALSEPTGTLAAGVAAPGMQALEQTSHFTFAETAPETEDGVTRARNKVLPSYP